MLFIVFFVIRFIERCYNYGIFKFESDDVENVDVENLIVYCKINSVNKVS